MILATAASVLTGEVGIYELFDVRDGMTGLPPNVRSAVFVNRIHKPSGPDDLPSTRAEGVQYQPSSSGRKCKRPILRKTGVGVYVTGWST
jgi:hypothetical protein